MLLWILSALLVARACPTATPLLHVPLARRQLSATPPETCAFSLKTAGSFVVPKPNCQLSKQIVLSGDFTCVGVEGETPLRELKAVLVGTATSSLHLRLFLIDSGNHKLTLKDLRLSGGRVASSQYGGMIWMNRGEVIITRCEYVVGHDLGISAYHGSFLFANGATAKKVTITSSTFDGTGSNSVSGGGCIYADNKIQFVVTDSVFKNWRCRANYGGVVYLHGSTTKWTSTGSTYESNSAKENGGVGRLQNSAQWHGTRDTFRNNVAEGNVGGAFYLSTSSQTHWTESTFVGNTAKNNGGAFYADGKSHIQLKGGRNRFERNKCKSCGSGARDCNTIYNGEGASGYTNFQTCKAGTFQEASFQKCYGRDFWGCEYSCPAGQTNEEPAVAVRRNANSDVWCTRPCPKANYCPGGIGGGTILCPAGKYGKAVALKTKECSGSCPLNSYCPEGSENPSLCPDGSSTLSVGGMSVKDCVTCGLGSIKISEDLPGSPLQCKICGKGEYNDATTFKTCKQCSSGRYNVDAGTDRLLHVDPLEDCHTCDRGLYFVSSTEFCR